MARLIGLIAALVFVGQAGATGLTVGLKNEIHDGHLIATFNAGIAAAGPVYMTASFGRCDGVPIGTVGHATGGITISTRGGQVRGFTPGLEMDALFSDSPDMHYRVRQSVTVSRMVRGVTAYAGGGVQVLGTGGPGEVSPLLVMGVEVENLLLSYARGNGRNSLGFALAFGR